MNAGECIIVYPSPSLTDAFCSALSACLGLHSCCNVFRPPAAGIRTPLLPLPACLLLAFLFVALFLTLFALLCVRYLPVVSMDSTDSEVISAGPGLLTQIRRHLRRLSYAFHRAIPQVIVRGPFSLSCWYGRPHAAVMLSVFCALCHGEYQYLTQLIRPFVLMEFSLSAAVPAEARCFLWVRQSCLLGPWVELRDRLRQTKVLCLAAAASTLCHVPFLLLTRKTQRAAFQRPPVENFQKVK